MRKRVLVTGGAGFIGSHTVDLLLKQGAAVTVLDNLATGHLANLPAQAPQLRFIEGDVLDYPLLLNSLADCDAVLHLAALPSVPQSLEDPLRSHRVNTLGFLFVLQALREGGKPRRLVYASSSAIYGEAKTLPCRELLSASEKLLSPYALEKAHNEDYAELYARLFQVPSLALRYFNVYGPRQDPASPYSGVISRFMAAYKAEQTLEIFGDGLQSRDFIHVFDVARANCLALGGKTTGVLNIASGVPETINQLLTYLEASGHAALKRTYAAPRFGDILHSYAATECAEQALNFKAEITLRDGVQTLLADA